MLDKMYQKKVEKNKENIKMLNGQAVQKKAFQLFTVCVSLQKQMK